MPDIRISVNDRVILPFREGALISRIFAYAKFREYKTLAKSSELTEMCYLLVLLHFFLFFIFFFLSKFCPGEFPVTTGRIVQNFGDMTNVDVKLCKTVSNNFSAQSIKIISRYKKIGYNINVLQQTS